ncbi:MAG: site-2 protease family protein [Flavobacteriales bacterium]|nr:site-2 protease family protein [Flavobacteriales bacterium]
MLYLELAIFLLALITVFGLISNLAFASAAKLFNVKIEEFTIWSDPYFRLLKLNIGGTVFKLGWLPLSSHIKLAGMTKEPEEDIEDYNFVAKPKWQQLLIMTSGPFSSLFLGFIFAFVYDHISFTQLSILISFSFLLVYFGSFIASKVSLIRSDKYWKLSHLLSFLYFSALIAAIYIFIDETVGFEHSLIGAFKQHFDIKAVLALFGERSIGKLGLGLGLFMFASSMIPTHSVGLKIVEVISKVDAYKPEVWKHISNYAVVGVILNLILFAYLAVLFFI